MSILFPVFKALGGQMPSGYITLSCGAEDGTMIPVLSCRPSYPADTQKKADPRALLWSFHKSGA